MRRRKSASAGKKDVRTREVAKPQTQSNAAPPAAFRPATGQVQDANGRRIFKNNSLCAQFIQDNIDIPELKNVKPEDITDVTEKYQAYLGFQLESDTVKRIRLHHGADNAEGDAELFVVSLIEHKSKVDYNVAMQLFRYMNCIWTEYAREMESIQKGISKTKGFRYPPILPIVYHEGSGNWTAGMRLSDRIHLSEVFGPYLPDFTYKLVRIHDYTNEELLDRKNEMSFLMMLNRIQNAEDLATFLQVEQEKVNDIVRRSSPQVLEIIADTIWSLCMKMNIPIEEAEECVRKVKEQDMGYLFENMEKMDIQEERRKTAEARKQLEEARQEVEKVKREAEETKREAEETKRAAEETRRAAEETRREAEETKRAAGEIQRQAEDTQRQAEETRRQIEEAQRQNREAIEQIARERREAISHIVSVYQRVGENREAAVRALMEAYHMEESAAQEEVSRYWKV